MVGGRQHLDVDAMVITDVDGTPPTDIPSPELAVVSGVIHYVLIVKARHAHHKFFNAQLEPNLGIGSSRKAKKAINSRIIPLIRRW